MHTAATDIAQQFETQGYLIVPDLFSPAETARLKSEIQAVVRDVRAAKQAAGADWRAFMRVGVYVGVAHRNAYYRRMVGDARILDVLEPLLGPDIEFLSDKAVFKDHDADFGSPWHQDYPYWKGSHKISLWVALDDATAENGCLKLVPGSHKQEVRHDGAMDDRGFGHRLDERLAPEEQAVSAPLAAGGAIVFHDLTLHASHANASGDDRWVWIPTYRSLHHADPPYEWAVAARAVRTAAP